MTWDECIHGHIYDDFNVKELFKKLGKTISTENVFWCDYWKGVPQKIVGLFKINIEHQQEDNSCWMKKVTFQQWKC